MTQRAAISQIIDARAYRGERRFLWNVWAAAEPRPPSVHSSPSSDRSWLRVGLAIFIDMPLLRKSRLRHRSTLLDYPKRIYLPDRRAVGGPERAWRQESVIARTQIWQEHLIHSVGDLLAFKRYNVSRSAARSVHHAAGHGSKLSRILLFAQMQQLILSDGDTLGGINDSLEETLRSFGCAHY